MTRVAMRFSTNAAVPARNNNATRFGTNIYMPGSTPFGYVVPAGKRLLITQASCYTKDVRYTGDNPDQHTWRNSGAIFYRMDTVGENLALKRYDPPIVCPPGFVVEGAFANNGPEEQNMIAWCAGWLVDEGESRTIEQQLDKIIALLERLPSSL